MTSQMWQASMDLTLTTAWTSGLSSTQIAVLIGGGISASAVRSRRAHLGLQAREGICRAAGETFRGKHKAIPSAAPPRKAMPTLSKPGPESQPIAMNERPWEACAFPLGEDDQGLIACGGPVPIGSRRRYCRFHLALTAQEVSHANERAA
jgi:hypothetical protein